MTQVAQAVPVSRRRLGPLYVVIAALALAAIVFASYSRLNITPDQLEVGKPTPDFTLADLSGAPVKLSDLRGQVAVVVFWRTD